METHPAGVTTTTMVTVKYGTSLRLFTIDPNGEPREQSDALELVELLRPSVPEGERMWTLAVAHDDVPKEGGEVTLALGGASLALGDLPDATLLEKIG